MATGSRATFVISWAQTEADGCQPALPGLMTAGAPWRWTGEAVRVDSPRDILVLEDALGMAEIRQRASRIVWRLTGQPGGAAHADLAQAGRLRDAARLSTGIAGEAEPPGQGFTVTDGVQCWYAIVMQGQSDLAAADPQGWLLAFEGAMPPKDRELWMLRSQFSAAVKPSARGVICFTSGTKIATPGGVRPVEALRPGDQVITRDNGAQQVIWTGQRHISGARLYAMPHLRPVRICAGALGQSASGEGRPDGDLLVSPGHRILMQGKAARALFGCEEVLVRAGDLINDRGIRTDLALREVTYHHFLLERHQVLFANGVGADSFHPGEADPSGLDAVDYARLCEISPGLMVDPASYGDLARRGLTAAEAALFLHERHA